MRRVNLKLYLANNNNNTTLYLHSAYHLFGYRLKSFTYIKSFGFITLSGYTASIITILQMRKQRQQQFV